MATPTKLKVSYKCGHTKTRDLSDVAAGKRKSRAKWYGETFDCWDCYKASNDKETAKDTNQRALDADTFAEENKLPELEGSEKQVLWASVLRHETVSEALDAADTDQANQILAAARQITWAGWWLDNLNWSEQKDNDMDAEDFTELILTGPAAQQDRDEKAAQTETENPF